MLSSVALYLASLAEVGQGRTLTRVEIAAIAWGVNIASGIINTVGTRAIGGMSTFNLWWTLGGTFVLVITLLVKAPVKVCFAWILLAFFGVSSCHTTKNTAEFVFTDYQKCVFVQYKHARIDSIPTASRAGATGASWCSSASCRYSLHSCHRESHIQSC